MFLKRFLMSVCLVVACALPAAAMAQPFHHGWGGGASDPMPMPMMMLLRHVNLTTDQQTKVHEIMRANFAEARPLMKQLHAIHDQIADKVMSPGTVSESDLKALQSQENQIHQQLDQKMLATALKIRGLLTPAQVAQAADLHTKLKGLRSQMQSLLGDDGATPATNPAE